MTWNLLDIVGVDIIICIVVNQRIYINKMKDIQNCFVRAGYYFNDTGLLACEPFYSKPSYRILATCSLYFPTTMILMYCYGSSFHASRFRLVVSGERHNYRSEHIYHGNVQSSEPNNVPIRCSVPIPNPANEMVSCNWISKVFIKNLKGKVKNWNWT